MQMMLAFLSQIILVCHGTTFYERNALILLLLNYTFLVLANSVDPDQLASEEANWSGSALLIIKYVNFFHKIDWLEIRGGRGILIYLAWQGLILKKHWIYLVNLMPFVYKGNNFCDFLLFFLHTKTLLKKDLF